MQIQNLTQGVCELLNEEKDFTVAIELCQTIIKDFLLSYTAVHVTSD